MVASIIVKQVIIVAPFLFTINIKRIKRYKYSQGCQRFWSKIQEHNSEKNKPYWKILLAGLITSISSSTTEHKKNIQCNLEGILFKKLKGAITGNILSVTQTFHPVILAASQHIAVTDKSKCTFAPVFADCFLWIPGIKTCRLF